MKIALLLSGLSRYYKKCFPTQLRALEGSDVDVYFHFWGSPDRNDIIDLLKPKAYLFEPQIDFTDWDNRKDIVLDSINVTHRTISQYYSWNRTRKLFDPDQYDLAVRSRSDLYFMKKIPIQSEFDLIMPFTPNRDAMFDAFAIGKPKTIDYYLSLYDMLPEYLPETPLNPEYLIGKHIRDSGINAAGADMSQLFFVYRGYMENMDPVECLKHPAGHSKWLEPEIIESHKKFHKNDEYVDNFAGHHIKGLL